MGEISRSGTDRTKRIYFCNSDSYIDLVQLFSVGFCPITPLLAKNVLIHSNSHPLIFSLLHLIRQGPVKKESLPRISDRGDLK